GDNSLTLHESPTHRPEPADGRRAFLRLPTVREKQFGLVHRAVGREVDAILSESAKGELLGVGRADVQVSLPLLLEIRKQLPPVAELFLISPDHILSNLIAVGAGCRPERRNTGSGAGSGFLHQVGDRALGYPAGRPAPSRVHGGHGAALRVRYQDRQTIGRLYAEQHATKPSRQRVTISG